MNVCGIIAEYDPFHTGHSWQISEVRRILGADCAVVCVLGGNFSQRGSPSMLEKHVRARMALLGGADLVLELPLPWATASAEGFARGGIALLKASGIVTHLCFGSEAGDLMPLQETADCLNGPDYPSVLRTHLDAGLSFPAARQKAAEDLLGKELPFLTEPNNNLGIEYLRALAGSDITPMTVRRRGAGHDSEPSDGFASGRYLRSVLLKGESEKAAPYMLPGALDETGPLADIRLGERAMLDSLRRLTEADLAALPDCGEGLSNRLYRAIRDGGGLSEILERAKTKRYSMSRLRRILLYAWLGLKAEDRPDVPLYIRVLGFNFRGQELLHLMKSQALLPLLSKPADVRTMSSQIQALFQLEIRATDSWGICIPEPSSCGMELQKSPVIIS